LPHVYPTSLDLGAEVHMRGNKSSEGSSCIMFFIWNHWYDKRWHTATKDLL